MSLSERGQSLLSITAHRKIWAAAQDAWDPVNNPQGFVSMALAENTLMHSILAEKIHDILQRSPSMSSSSSSDTPDNNGPLPFTALTYGEGGQGSRRLRIAVARFLTRWLHPARELRFDQITITNGCTSAIEHLSWMLANPGEGMLLGRPYYGTFISDIQLRPGVEVLEVSFGLVDPVSLSAVALYERRILQAQEKGQRVAALMLCQPHNPLGRVYSRETLVAFMKLCQKYQIHLISDEAYALSIWINTVDDPTRESDCPGFSPFESILGIDTTGIIEPHLVHCIWGPSKDFGASGLRVGTIISQGHPSLHVALVPLSLYSYASSISEFVAATLFEDHQWTEAYITENRRRLSKNYGLVTAFAKKHGILYKKGVQSGFFIWVELGSLYRQARAKEGITEDAEIDLALLSEKVVLATGTDFGSEELGWFRIVFSHPKHILEEGLRRILAAVQPPSNGRVLKSRL